ncbi:MAG: fumarylacetoacetate hydrolase family protein [Candidatus Dormibacteraceae bacterium]
MRVVVYGNQRRVGAWEGAHIVDLERAARSAGRGALPADLLGLIETGERGLETAARAVEQALRGGAGPGAVLDREEVELRAPWPGRRIACVGGNFADHLLGMFRDRPGAGAATPESITAETRDAGQWGFWKVPAQVLGPGGEIPYPARTEYLDFEGEVGIVLGRAGKDISAGGYREHVWGVTLLNDGSIREGMGRPWPMSYNLGKNFDGSTAIGPCILTGDVDPEDLEVTTRVNGEVRQRFSVHDMIFSWGEVLEHLSRDFTLVPGDIVSGGTGAGTAADRTVRRSDGTRPTELFLHHGDTIEIASPPIGTLALGVV